jgi:RNA-directed DNA polymerase
VLLRLIGKWLKAGVLEAGNITYPERGTPQGGVISPLLANIYLHEVVDTWFEQDVRPRLHAEAALVRYADDFVLLFREERDARRVMAVLPQRCARYGLTLHPEKTRLLRFTKPKDSGGREWEGFDFLGFTHHWRKSLKGWWVVMRKTASSRLSRALRRVGDWCRKHRHLPLAEQHQMLAKMVKGHYAYYGITGNAASLANFAEGVERRWHKWLARRSQRRMSWERFRALRTRYPLPRPRIVHSVFLRPAANP